MQDLFVNLSSLAKMCPAAGITGGRMHGLEHHVAGTCIMPPNNGLLGTSRKRQIYRRASIRQTDCLTGFWEYATDDPENGFKVGCRMPFGKGAQHVCGQINQCRQAPDCAQAADVCQTCRWCFFQKFCDIHAVDVLDGDKQCFGIIIVHFNFALPAQAAPDRQTACKLQAGPNHACMTLHMCAPADNSQITEISGPPRRL